MPHKVAIMQPYLFPYLGYFQLIKAVDEFVVYDNIQYTKKGWINRNRILVNGKDEYISVPLKKDSDYLDIKERFLADTWETEKKKVINKVSECYRKAPCYKDAMPVIENCLLFEGQNLFDCIFNSLKIINEYLEIKTTHTISSAINIDHKLRSVDKVIAICKALNAKQYLNPIGGIELYNKDQFEKEGLQLSFLKSNNVHYSQFSNEFVPYLSIIDVMMFNDKAKVKDYLATEFTLQ